MLRAIVLSLALLIGLGTIVPLATQFAEAGARKQRKYKKKGVKKYSKRWWRAYNKRKRLKRARIRRARSARVRRARLARVRRTRNAATRRSSTARRSANQNAQIKAQSATPETNGAYVAQAVLPSGKPAPNTWKSEGMAQGELQFRVTNSSGSPIGAAAISVVGPAIEDAPMFNSRVTTVGGITTNALRRTVIDQMIRDNGWVVNDYQKEVGGKKVYVVVAQSPGANNQVENRMFYFTESGGKIYSVATKSPDNGSERLEEESEKVLNSLNRTMPTTQVASNRTMNNLVANEE